MEIFLADPIVKITAEKYEYQGLWSLVFSVHAPGDPSPIIYAGIESLELLQQLLSGWQPAISALEVFQRFGIKPGDPIAGRSFYFPDDGKSAVGHWILPRTVECVPPWTVEYDPDDPDDPNEMESEPGSRNE